MESPPLKVDCTAISGNRPSEADRRVPSLDLHGKKKLRCRSGLDKLPGGTLGVGEYRFEVAVVDREDLALGLRPFSVDAPPPDEEPAQTATDR